MSFTEKLLIDINEYQDNNIFEKILYELKSADTIGVWGTGLAGTMIFESLCRLGIKVNFFLDNDEKKVGTKLYGLEIKGIQNEIPSNTLIIIAANVKYKIHDQLKKLSLISIYIDPVYLYSLREKDDTISCIKANSQCIDRVYDMLHDDWSRKVYYNILLHRAVHDIKLVWDVYDEHQYFGNNVIDKARGCFVDCGAFQGDTLKCFLKQVGDSEYQYFALEADSNNYEILKEYCAREALKNVYPINLGVWDKKECLHFLCDDIAGEVAGKISEDDSNTIEIPADSIDNILGDVDIDFIKMDIEGAEMNALVGATESIRKSRPILAISVYHELEHLWEVPLKIKEINNNYQIFFAHHMWNMADTVCYAKMP